MKPSFRLLVIAVLAFVLSPNSDAQRPAPSLVPRTNVVQSSVVPTNVIAPTVTAESGDLGGKFFGRTPDPAKTRRYYIAAEPELWDFAPLGSDPICGKTFPPPLVSKRRSGKVRYVQYTDATFRSKVIPKPSLGIMGPALRGQVGEFLAVTFLNRIGQPLSMHPHGAKYDKDSEGSYYEPKPGRGAAVGPNATFTYVWQLDEDSGPLPGEPSSKAWLYHSHVNGDEETNMGLIGCIIVTDPKRARPDGTPNDVDRELATLYMIFDESGLGEAEKEAAEYASLPGGGLPAKTWTEVQELMEQGARVAINGYVFGNLPGLEANEGERVRWYLFGLGSKEDFHTAHWHGLRVIEDGRRRTDVVELLPASMKVADMLADNPGTWLMHCHVAEHMMDGMFARFVVHPKGSAGANRAPADAFLGLPKAEESLRIQTAELRVDLSPGAAKPCELKLAGNVTVFAAFSVFTQPIQVQVGATSIAFKPDRQGTAIVPNGSWRVKNASRYGVVYGGLMEFETTLTSTALLDELKKLGVITAAGSGEISIPLTMHVGQARHTAIARATWRAK